MTTKLVSATRSILLGGAVLAGSSFLGAPAAQAATVRTVSCAPTVSYHASDYDRDDYRVYGHNSRYDRYSRYGQFGRFRFGTRRDVDGDGIRNRFDRDIDGDGIRNSRDHHPRNPWRR